MCLQPAAKTTAWNASVSVCRLVCEAVRIDACSGTCASCWLCNFFLPLGNTDHINNQLLVPNLHINVHNLINTWLSTQGDSKK